MLNNTGLVIFFLLFFKIYNIFIYLQNGVTPLHVAAHYDHVNVALLLLDKGAFPHATAKNGYTPLHIASKKNQMDIATTLLEYGAKPSAESKVNNKVFLCLYVCIHTHVKYSLSFLFLEPHNVNDSKLPINFHFLTLTD